MGRAAHASNFRTRESEAGGFGAFEISLRYRFRACLTGIKTLLQMSSLLGLPSPHYLPSVYSFLLFRDRTLLCSFGRLELTRQSSLALNTAIPTASVSHQWGIKASPPLPRQHCSFYCILLLVVMCPRHYCRNLLCVYLLHPLPSPV